MSVLRPREVDFQACRQTSTGFIAYCVNRHLRIFRDADRHVFHDRVFTYDHTRCVNARVANRPFEIYGDHFDDLAQPAGSVLTEAFEFGLDSEGLFEGDVEVIGDEGGYFVDFRQRAH